MKVSVVIPARNEEKFIGKCLQSLFLQREKPDEIILVDNNSRDHTVKIAQKYNVRVIYETKQGMIPARNTGFDNARFEIIARTDADTQVPPDWIARIKKNFKNKSIVALSGPIQYDRPFLTLVSEFNNLITFKLNKLILRHENLFGPNFSLRRKVWRQVRDDICHDDRKVHEDLDLTIHIARYGVIQFDPGLIVTTSARRLSKPSSMLIDYPSRWIKTYLRHTDELRIS